MSATRVLLPALAPVQRSTFTSTMSITHITSTSQLDGILSKSKDKLTVRRNRSWHSLPALTQCPAGHRLPCNMVLKITCYNISNDIQNASRCGPCHIIAPVFETLAKQYTNVNFLKCDVDAARDVASRYSVSAMCVVSILHQLQCT